MATSKETSKTPATDAVLISLESVFNQEEVVGTEASFELTPELRAAVERGAKATAENPGGWLRISIPASFADANGTEVKPTDDEAKTILSNRENDLRAAAAQMGLSFRRQTPKANGKETYPRVMLYRINKKETKPAGNVK